MCERVDVGWYRSQAGHEAQNTEPVPVGSRHRVISRCRPWVAHRKVAPMARRNEWKYLLTAAENAGWTYRPCKHGLYVYPPTAGARPIVLGGTPSDHRSFMNTRAALRRAGLNGI